jgi:hypothetical protein
MVGLAVGSVVVHRLLVAALCSPRMISLPWWVMVHLVAVKFPSQPTSQNLPRDSKDVGPRSGNMWASVAVLGSCGMGSSAVWVEYMNSWLASWTGIGSSVGVVLGREASVEK